MKKIYIVLCMLAISFDVYAIDWSGMANNVGRTLGAAAVVGTAAVLAPSMAPPGYGQLGVYGPSGMIQGYGGVPMVNGATTAVTNWGNNAVGAITPGLAPTMPNIGGAMSNPGSFVGGMAGMAAASLMGRTSYGGYGVSPYGATSPYGNVSYDGGMYGATSAYGNAFYGGGTYGVNSPYGGYNGTY